MTALRCMLILFSILGLAARTATAGFCSHSCGEADGDLCISLHAPDSRQPLRSQIVPVGKPVMVQIGRQLGTCGGRRIASADESEMRYATSPQGPFLPLPLSPIEGAALWVPERAGAIFLSARPRDGRGSPDNRVVLVTASETDKRGARLQLDVPPPLHSLGSLTVRWVPPAPDESEASGFPRSRWPLLFDGSVSSPDVPLSAPPQPQLYEVAWSRQLSSGMQSALLRVKGTGDAVTPVRIPRQGIALRPVVSSGHALWLVLHHPDGVAASRCLNEPIPGGMTLYTAPGRARLEIFSMASSSCAHAPSEQQLPQRTEEVSVTAERLLRIPWRALAD